MARVSGVSILGLVKFIKKNLKDKSIEDFLRSLDSEDDRHVFGKRIVPTEWYPYQTYIDLLTLLDNKFGKGDLSFARELGRMSAENDLRGIYRAFLRIGPTKFIMKRFSHMWNGYFDTGNLVVEPMGENKDHVRLSAFPEIKKIHCKTVEGWIERFRELGGAKGVRVREIQCTTEGAPLCIFEVTYESL